MSLTILEVFLLTTQIILIPLARYFFIKNTEAVLIKTKAILSSNNNKNLHSIYQNRENIAQLKEKLQHRITLLKIRQDVLQARISDLEMDLGKQNGFQCDVLKNIENYEDSNEEQSKQSYFEEGLDLE